MQRAAAPSPALDIRELSINDIGKMLEIMYVSRAGLQKRFLRGERCFAVMDNDKIMGFFWAQFGLKCLKELRLRFNLAPNQTWMYNAITVKAARGQGLYPNIIRYMAKVLSDSGIEQAFVDVKMSNVASCRGLEKAGFTRVAIINMRKVLSSVKYRLAVLDNKAWQGLSDTIEDIGQIRLQYVSEQNICP